MADVKTITIGNTVYDIHDAVARTTKQDTLVSGTNIKTVNNQSLLGSGNITISGEGSGGTITVDSALSSSSENPVQNKVINSALSGKQATLVSGTNIKTVNNQSLLGSGNITIEGGSGGSISVDSALSSTSENPVQNKAIYSAISGFKNITISSSTPTSSDGSDDDIWIVIS